MSFLKSSSIRNVRFSLPIRRLDPLSRQIPFLWENLTTLHLGDFREYCRLQIPNALEVLRHCPGVMRCTLYLEGGRATSPADESPIFLPCLKSLAVDVSGSEPTRRMVVPLDCPALSKLEYSPGYLADGNCIALLKQPISCLQSLTIHCQSLTRRKLVAYLRQACSITHLRLYDAAERGSPVNDIFFQALTDNARVCPALQMLELLNCSCVSDNALQRFIDSRLLSQPGRVGTLIKVVTFTSHPRLGPPSIELFAVREVLCP